MNKIFVAAFMAAMAVVISMPTVAGDVTQDFTWATATNGNWSDGARWGVSAPVAAGAANYTLNFNAGGTYTATNNLNVGFLLNRLNLGGSTLTLAGSSLAFSANGSTLPQINQNSASVVTISAPINLMANATFGGSGNGKVTLSGVISGTGSLTKTSSGTLEIFGVNTYTGGTVINAGELHVDFNATLGSAGSVNVTVNSGATLTGNRTNFVGNLTMNGGTWKEYNGFGGSWTGPVTLSATSTCNSGDSETINGVVSGPGGWIKTGSGKLTFNGANTFTGPMTIQTGTLLVSSLNSVAGGTASSDLGAPTTVANGTISFGSGGTPGTLICSGPGETTDRIIKLAGTTGGATITQAGTQAGVPTTRGVSGLLKFTSNISIPGTAGVDNRKTLILANKPGALTGSTTGQGEIAGNIGDSLLGNAGQLATSITKTGQGIWILSGMNTYTGKTSVQSGTLVITRQEALGTGAVDISAPATFSTTGMADPFRAARLQLDFVGTRQVAALTFNGGALQPNGTYGSSRSMAQNKDDLHFAGLGTLTVGPVAPPITLARTAGTNPSEGGSKVTFTATVSGTAGNVIFYDGLTILGQVDVNTASQAVFSTSTLTAGTHTITAVHMTGATAAPSYAAPLAHVVNEGRSATTTSLALTSGGNPSNFNGAVTFTATVTSGSTGNVVFHDGGAYLGTAALNGAGQAAFTISSMAAGRHAITARYEGDDNRAPSASTPTLFHTVNPPAGNGKLKVFILAGQSNMVGYGRVELGRATNDLLSDKPTLVAGGLGSLRRMLNANPDVYGYLADSTKPIAGGSPGWLSPADVWVTYYGGAAWDITPPNPTHKTLRKGNLDPYFGVNGVIADGRNGPEYGFGLVASSQFADQVLIIKYGHGGRSLGADFRPPSSGGTVGPCYLEMVGVVRQVLNNIAAEFPAYTGGGSGYELVGLGWHQGWNDQYDPAFIAGYEANFVNLVNDLRTEFASPNMRACIGVTGMANATDGSLQGVIAAQMAVADPTKHPALSGAVATVETRAFDKGLILGASGEGFHWNFSGESYFNIGDRMGWGMMGLKDIQTFRFPGLSTTNATISGTNITLTVPAGTNLSALVPEFTLSPLATASPASGTLRDFSNPQTYTITAADNSTKTYTVTISVAGSSSAKDILNFVFPGLAVATISGTNISVIVPAITNVTSLAPTYTMSALATGNPVSGTTLNFTTPQNYTITAQDGSTKTYTVTVIKRALLISNAPFATPNPANAGRVVQFTVAATGNDPLTYQWDLGDGSNAVGATLLHSYSVPGNYTVMVTVSDASGQSATGSLQMRVVSEANLGDDTDGDGVPNGLDDDDDNDGVSDLNEVADGTDPLNPTSATKFPFEVLKMSGSAKFNASGKDSCSISGMLPDQIPGFNPQGVVFKIDIGGAIKSFTLDAKGRAKTTDGSLGLKFKLVTNKTTKKKEFLGGSVPFQVKISKGSWTDEWSDEGVDPTTSAAKKPMPMVVDISVGGRIYTHTVSVIYSSKAKVGAKFKK